MQITRYMTLTGAVEASEWVTLLWVMSMESTCCMGRRTTYSSIQSFAEAFLLLLGPHSQAGVSFIQAADYWAVLQKQPVVGNEGTS